MRPNVIDIILHIVRRLQTGDTLEEISDESFSGYNTSEISAAYSWIVQKHKAGDLPKPVTQGSTKHQKSHRVLHMAEKMMITPEAHGFMLELINSGLIDHLQMERVIEKLMLTPTERVTKAKIKETVSKIIFNNEPTNPLASLFLTGNETIN
ncbi:MAG: DUF494 family protein [Bacteroidota bacterium]